MTPIDKGVIALICVSHGCEIWRGRHVTPEEFRALQIVHALQHSHRLITPADLFGETENDS